MSGVIGEFIGTFLFTLTISLTSTASGELAPIAVGFMLMSLVFAFGYLSGGHFNPAVTGAVYLSRDGPETLRWHKATLYWMAQCGAAACAGLYCILIQGGDFAVPETPDDWNGIGRSLIREAIYTFVLCSVVLHVAVSRQKDNNFYGFAIGMAVMSAALANRGGAYNPAVATGLIVVKCFTGTCLPILHLWVFWLGELGGCLAATILYNAVSLSLEKEMGPHAAPPAPPAVTQAPPAVAATLPPPGVGVGSANGGVAMHTEGGAVRVPAPVNVASPATTTSPAAQAITPLPSLPAPPPPRPVTQAEVDPLDVDTR
jgi:glycerol uptake facilitator-like aquaporin